MAQFVSWVIMAETSRVLPAPGAPKKASTISGSVPGWCCHSVPQRGQNAVIWAEPNSSSVFIRFPQRQYRRTMPNRPGPYIPVPVYAPRARAHVAGIGRPLTAVRAMDADVLAA